MKTKTRSKSNLLKLTPVFLLLVLFFCGATPIFADDIPIEFPNTTIDISPTAIIPVSTPMDITSQNIIGIQGAMIFDPNKVVVKPATAVITVGTMSESWGNPIVNIVNGNELHFSMLNVMSPLVWSPEMNVFFKIHVTAKIPGPTTAGAVRTSLVFTELLLVDDDEQILPIAPAQPASVLTILKDISPYVSPAPVSPVRRIRI